MNKRVKRIIVALLTCALAGILSVAVHQLIRWNSMVNEELLLASNESQSNDEDDSHYVVFDDEERQKWLDLLDEKKTIILTGADNDTRNHLVELQNGWRQEFENHIDELYGQTLDCHEYDVRCNTLRSILAQWSPIEPHRTPTEELQFEIERQIDKLDGCLWYGEHQSEKHPQYNVSKIKRLMKDLAALTERIDSEQLTFEEASKVYHAFLFAFEAGSTYPPVTAFYPYNRETMLQRLRRVDNSYSSTAAYTVLGAPDRYGQKSVLSDDYYKEVFYVVDETTEAIVSFNNNTIEEMCDPQHGSATVYLRNTATGEITPLSEVSG